MIYLLAFVAGGLISIGYLYLINQGLDALAKAHEKHTTKTEKPSTASAPPSATPSKAESDHEEELEKAKEAGRAAAIVIGKSNTPPSKALPPPLIKSKSFSTIIPLCVDKYRATVPYDSNTNDPLLLTYTILAGISDLPVPEPPYPVQGPFVQPKLTDADVQIFLGHLMQYYILREINELQNPISYMSYQSGKGTSTQMDSAVAVPDPQEFENAEVFKLFEKLNLGYGTIFGPNDVIWKRANMKVPSGTKIDFVETLYAGKTNYIVRFERPSDLLLDFRIEPTTRTQGVGTLPQNFVLAQQREPQDVYSYFFTIHTDLRWTGDRLVGQDYGEWANGLEEGLRRKLVIP